MAKIFDANDGCCFEKSALMFDTNIWIAIHGNNPRPESIAYSNYYADALLKKNEVWVNEYVISEYFNRSCKIEYEILFGRDEWNQYKRRRQDHAAFIDQVEAVKEICLDILADCKYLPSTLNEKLLEAHLDEAAQGNLDMTDSILVQQCKSKNIVFVSHDRDFQHVDINLVTANGRVLASR